ncbi:MAG TPA: calcium-binding protein [Allosphingosinicella sp.]|jgi:Ca2+-binding RTX toxin-like protein
MATLFVGPGGYSTIQEAVNASADGDSIVIAAGIYVEQVTLDHRDNLTLRAAEGAQVTIQAPADLVETARSSGDREIHAVLTVLNSLNVTIDNVDIDGHGAGTTVDEGGGAGIANFYGVYYRNASGTLLGVDITGVRDPYPGGTTAGGHPLVDGVQRGVGLVVDNDSMLAFTMTGGSITDFQKQGATFVRADVTITGVTITGGGAQTVIAQNGISINRSTGTISGNTISEIGYAGPAGAYSGIILASSNTDLAITGNSLTGTNAESAASKVVGVWIYQNGLAVSGGEVTGNTVGGTDVGVYVNDSVAPDSILIENNSVPAVDTTDPNASGVKLDQNIAVTTVFDTDGSQVADLLRGAAGNDVLSGLEGDDILIGNAGDDYLDGGAGNDAMSGGTGNDIFIVDSQLDSVAEADLAGTDEIRTGLAVYSMEAQANVENLTGTLATGQDLRANSGDNIVTVGAGTDIIRLQDGGDDTVSGMAGIDAFYFGGALTAADNVDGGSGADTIILQGDYSGGLTLDGSVSGIENISILAGTNTGFGDPGTNLYDYVLTTADANFAAGIQARINGSALLADENFTFDGSAETDAKFVVYGGRGKDDLTGGAGNDIFFFAPGRFAQGDTVDGGGGYDGLFLRGNYTVDFTQAGYAGALANVENLTVSGAGDERYARGGGTEFDYSITWDNDLLAGGMTFTVNASTLGSEESLAFNGSDETDGSFRLFGGAGNDVLTGGAGADQIFGGLRGDTLTGGAGNDVFRYNNVAESNSTERDGIQDFNAGDLVDLSRIDANTLVAGDQAFNFVGNAAFSGTAGELRFENISLGGPVWLVQGDTNGDGVSDFEVVLVINPPDPITSSDFIL